MSSYDVLVIFLSVALGVSLIFWITVAVLLIKVIKKISDATDKARQAVESVEALTDNIRNITNASAFGSVAAKLWKKFTTKKRS